MIFFLVGVFFLINALKQTSKTNYTGGKLIFHGLTYELVYYMSNVKPTRSVNSLEIKNSQTDLCHTGIFLSFFNVVQITYWFLNIISHSTLPIFVCGT